MAIGAFVGLVVFLIPPTRFVFSYLGTLIHELGHTVVAWAFGYPAIPAFDFRHGGGVSMHLSGRSAFLVLVCIAAWAYLIVRVKDRVRVRNLVLVAAGLYALAALTPLHQMLELAMGHGAELIFAGIFLYRALSGAAVVHGQLERVLYAACGTLLVLENVHLSWGLVSDVDVRTAYGMAKGGGNMMDLDRIAIDFLSVPVQTPAGLLLIASLVTPVVTYLVFLNLGGETS